MALPYKKVLCPIDFEENSMAALESAAEIVRREGGTLYVLHVIQRVVQPMGMPMETDIYQAQEEAARKRLNEIARERLEGVAHELMTCVGDPAPSILKKQRQLGVDLIVAGTHGRRGFSRLFLGSVAEQVIREASCPVLTVHGQAPDAEHAPA